MSDKVKKLVLLNLPYLIFVYLFDKLCQGVRLAPGADASEKLLTSGRAFRRPLPVWRPASIWWICAWAPPARC